MSSLTAMMTAQRNSGQQLLCRALEARSDLPIAVVLAQCEFEVMVSCSSRVPSGAKRVKRQSATPEQSGGDIWCKGVVESTDGG